MAVDRVSPLFFFSSQKRATPHKINRETQMCDKCFDVDFWKLLFEYGTCVRTYVRLALALVMFTGKYTLGSH